MKKIFALLFISISSVALAQDSDADAHRYVSVGIRASIFQISELNNSILPPNRLIVSVDPIKFLRVEGHFALYKNQYQQTYGSALYNLTDKSNLFGGGIFGVYPKEKVKFIGGVRFSKNNYTRGNVAYNSFGNPYAVSDKGGINIFSGVLGGEYSFSKWFSIGAEFSYVKMKDVLTPGTPGSVVTTSKKSVTESALILRFYPY